MGVLASSAVRLCRSRGAARGEFGNQQAPDAFDLIFKQNAPAAISPSNVRYMRFMSKCVRFATPAIRDLTLATLLGTLLWPAYKQTPRCMASAVRKTKCLHNASTRDPFIPSGWNIMLQLRDCNVGLSSCQVPTLNPKLDVRLAIGTRVLM